MVRSKSSLHRELCAWGPAGETRPPDRRERRTADGFTLVEMLVSMAILVVIVVLGLNLLGQTTIVWGRSIQQIQAFQAARLGFDLMTRDLSQSTLNTYLEYVDGQAAPGPYFASDTKYNNLPVRYARKSDLHFVCAYPGTDMTTDTISSDPVRMVPGTHGTGNAVFFQAPLGYTAPVTSSTALTSDVYSGLATLLNGAGYFVEFGTDTVPPHAAANASNQKSRYRLKQLLIPSDRNAIYALTTSSDSYDPANPARWFAGDNLSRPDPNNASSPIRNVNAVADNILALVVRVQDPGTPNLTGSQHSYKYDSHAGERTLDAGTGAQPLTANQMPPLLQVTMVALDEISALRLNAGTAEPAALRSLLDQQVNGKAMFTDTTHYDADLANLEKGLRTLRVNYRVFATAVPVRESKWTR